MNKDLKKALSLAAIGFLFTFVNINLKINTLTINVMPDFIGWILLFMAHDNFGKYVAGKSFLKWTALILAIASIALWILGIYDPNMDLTLYTAVVNVIAAVYMFMLFSVISNVARDMGSAKAETITFLKYLNFFIFLALSALGFIGLRIDIKYLAIAATILGALAIGAAVISAIVLFSLRKEASEV